MMFGESGGVTNKLLWDSELATAVVVHGRYSIWGFTAKCLVISLGCILSKIGKIGRSFEENKEKLNLPVPMLSSVITNNYHVLQRAMATGSLLPPNHTRTSSKVI